MSLALDIIRDKIASEVAPADVGLVAGMIADRISADADMAAINTAIGAAKVEWAPLFAKKAADTKPAANESKLPVGFKAAIDKASSRLQAATSGGNPWQGDAWNLTRQVALEYADPALAGRLKAEAAQ